MKCVQMTSSVAPKEWVTTVKARASGNEITKECVAVLDTGANSTIITRDLFETLKADETGQVMNCTPTGEEKTITSNIDINFYDDCVLKNVQVLISEHNMDCDILIGMNVITKGDFHCFRDSDGLYRCTFRVYET